MGEVVRQNKRSCEIHASLRHVMRLCRWAGFFPVEGFNDTYPRRVRFNIKSLYTVYYIVSIILMIFVTCASFDQLFFKENGFGIAQISELVMFTLIAHFVFSLSNTIASVLLYRIAKQWSKLIEAAFDMEKGFAVIRTSTGVHVKITYLSYTVLIAALVEHLFCTALKMKLVISCLGYTKIDFEVIEIFFKNHYRFCFDYIPYDIWLGILAELVSVQGTFIWNFVDVMGMCFSMYLTSYFQDIGKIMNSNKPKDWAKLRAYYSRVVVLLNLINDQLSPFILMSSFTNLFFICLQLFNCLHEAILGHKLCISIANHIKNAFIAPEYQSYYFFSFVFLVTRAMLFSCLAANVHTSAYKAVLSLYEVPSSEYNEEVQCFQMQLRYTTVGLSGLFFSVERKMILRAITLIVTYELVLLQFSYGDNYTETKPTYTKVVALSEI